MNDDKGSAAFDVFVEVLLFSFGPHFTVVVGEDGVVIGELGLPVLPCLGLGASGWGGGDGHREDAVFFKGFLEDGGGLLPLVVVLSVEDEDGDFILRHGEGREQGEGDDNVGFHDLVGMESEVLQQLRIESGGGEALLANFFQERLELFNWEREGRGEGSCWVE